MFFVVGIIIIFGGRESTILASKIAPPTKTAYGKRYWWFGLRDSYGPNIYK